MVKAVTKYPLIPLVAEQHLKWKLYNEEGWTLMWNDHAITPDMLRSLSRLQKINHFPGMSELSRKNRLAKNLNLMRKELPEVTLKRFRHMTSTRRRGACR